MNDKDDINESNQTNDTSDPLDRIGRELRAIAVDIPLRQGSELATVRTAHRRRHRRRNVTAAAAAVVVAGGTTVVIQQLARPATIGTADEPTTPGTVLAPEPAPTTIPSDTPIPPGTTIPRDPFSALMAEIADQIVPAVPVESNYIWNVVTPEAANAVYGRFDGQVPGVIVSTAPGRAATDGVPERALYYTDDGISYQRLDVAPPSGLLRTVVSRGDRIYNVGTAPGVAATDPNPVRVEYSADRGVTWDSVELPIDAHAERNLPMLHESWGVGAVPTDAGVVVLVQHQTTLDFRELPDPTLAYGGYDRDGLRVIDAQCTPTTVAAVVEEPAVAATTTTYPEGATHPERSCAERLIAWDELGVPPETVDAMFERGTRAFRVVDGSATEMPLPDGVDLMYPLGTDDHLIGLSLTGDGPEPEQQVGTFEVTPDGNFVALPEPGNAPTCCGVSTQATSTHEFVDLGSPVGAERILASSADRTTWTYTDTSALYGELDYSAHSIAAAADDALISAVMVHRDKIAEGGGVSIEVDGIVLERPSSRGALRALDAETGAVLAESVDTFDDHRGFVVVQDTTTGAALAEITYAQLDELFGDATFDDSPRWAIETTADGVHVASEPVAGILGLTDAEVSSVGRITTVGRQVIVAVTLEALNPDGTHVQKVLVGTPKA